MRSFFWRGTDPGRGGGLVAWSSVCRPFADGGLGIHHLQHANFALLCKWITRIMQPSEDLISHLLRESYGSTLDWDVWATPRRGDSPVMAGLREIFPLVRPFVRPQLGCETDFRFWEDDWTGQGRLAATFPRLYGLTTARNVSVRSTWTGTWNPPLPQALSDQRLAEFLRLQSHLVDIRPLEATRDAWVWRQSRFTVKAVYRLLCGQLPPENEYVTQRCRLIWKRHIPLKIRILGWLLLRRRLMTRVARQRMFPDSPVCCPLCGGGPEDCSHLFFQCPLAQEAWRGAAVARLSVTSEETF